MAGKDWSDIDIECKVLMAIYLSDENAKTYLPLLNGSYFQYAATREFFNIMYALSIKGKMDLSKDQELSMLLMEVKKRNLDVLTYIGYFSNIATVPCSKHMIHEYIKELDLRNRAFRAEKALRVLCNSIDPNISKDRTVTDPQTYLDRLISIADKATNALAINQVRSNNDHVSEFYAELCETHTKKTLLKGMTTGFWEIDTLTRGLRKGWLVVVAARPGDGKTSLVLQMGNACEKDGYSVCLLSLEMTGSQLVSRLISQNLELTLDEIESNRNLTNPDRMQKIVDEMNRIESSKFTLIDDMGISWKSIMTAIRTQHMKKKHDMYIIDHLQLIKNDTRFIKTHEFIGEVTRTLKEMAKELDCVIIVLSQLRRPDVKVKKPLGLEDLKDSGNIEQDADLILMIDHRDKKRKGDRANEQDSDILIPKFRFGKTGRIPCTFKGEYTKFVTL